jgi:threonine dehydrogenase-like Zn-dependent dehydrogenase
MRTLRAIGNGRVEVVETKAPAPRDGDVLIRVEASALCGSERAAFEHGSTSNAGHEAAGLVVEAPPGSFDVGERVGVSAIRGCRDCASCRAGLETRCEAGPQVATGMHAELVTAPVRAVRAIPDGVGAATAALMSGDALGVPIRSLARAPHEPDATVVVLGLGPVGCSHVLARTFRGANVIGIDPSPYRRELARLCGAVDVLDGSTRVPSASLVIEATGRPECVQAAFDAVRPGGVVLQSGECSSVEINPSQMIIHREITYIGAWYYTTSDYPNMMCAIEDGLAIDTLITHEVAAADAQAAVMDFLAARSGKVILRWQD